MKLNTKPAAVLTHEGGQAARYIPPVAQLRRTVLACLLWEKEFYEDGKSIADRIMEYAKQVSMEVLIGLAREARKDFNLRHVPLLLLCALAKYHTGAGVSTTIASVISRADELTEFLAIYAKVNNQEPYKLVLSSQVKKGLAKAFKKFSAYQLAKYNRKSAIRLTDVLRLVHPKPDNEEQSNMWKRLIQGELESPDTWEVALSSGADKKETFTRLIQEDKLGYLALLRNLRNMEEAGVDRKLVTCAIAARKGAEKVLPFRYIAAARQCPSYALLLDAALMVCLDDLPKLTGTTVVLVDVSGSMSHHLSSKSDLTRMDAAAALASIIRSDDLHVFSFSERLVRVPPYRGLAGIDSVIKSQPNCGTYLGEALQTLYTSGVTFDRLIIITDEQISGRRIPVPLQPSKNYIINVASYQNGIGYTKDWVNLTGFSENIIKYIVEYEKEC